MAQNAFRFPVTGLNEINNDRIFGPPLQASGNLTYLEFISVVKALWENAYPDIKLHPTAGGQYAEYPVIVYGLELKKAHTVEPKPRSRNTQAYNNIMVFGQRFQNVVSFTIMTKADQATSRTDLEKRYSGAMVADNLAEIFEDFMLEHTPVFKRLGAAELVYSRRLSDAEINRDNTDVIKRTITYMLTTEKLIATTVDNIEKIAIDVRRYMAYEKSITDEYSNALATPNYEDVEIQIIDLFQTATPDYGATP
jgi:hypothetical protein